MPVWLRRQLGYAALLGALVPRIVCAAADDPVVLAALAAAWAGRVDASDPLRFGGPRPDQIAVGDVTVKMSADQSRYLEVTRTATRGRIVLNGVWRLSNAKKLPALDPLDTDQQKDPLAPFPDPPTNETPPQEGWRDILVPSIGGYTLAEPWTYRRGLDWYHRTFVVPVEWQGDRVILRFDAIYYEAVCYLNGKYMAWTRSDVLPWEIDITAAVNFGKPNDLYLRIRYGYRAYGYPWKNAFVEAVSSSIIGLPADVFVCRRPPLRVYDVFIKPSFRKKAIQIEYECRNDTPRRRTIRIESSVTELNGSQVLRFPAMQLIVEPGEVSAGTNRADWADPHLWSPSDPHLYLVETRLLDDHGQIIDVHKERFGFREIWIEAGQFRINGRIVQFNQCTIYHDSPVGHRRVIAAQMRRLKALGFNMIRYFNKPYAVDLEVADEVGMYIKAQSGWHHPAVPMNPAFQKDARVQIANWVRRDRNHPSLVMWCSENEAYTSLIDTRRLVWELIRRNDPTRPIDTDGGYGHSIYDEKGRIRTGAAVDWQEIINPHYPGLMSGQASLLTQIDMPVAWSKTKPKPLFFGEWGHIYDAGRVSRPARHFHDLFQEKRPSWFSLETLPAGFVDYMEAVWPYWSRLGVAGQEHYGQGSAMGYVVTPHRDGYPTTEDREYIPIRWDRLDSLGTKTAYYRYFHSGVNPGLFPDLPVFEIPPIHQRYADLFRPIYAFFLDRTYAVYGGTMFRRSLCILNRSDGDVTVRGTARLVLSGRPPGVCVKFSATVPQGGFRDVPVAMALPEVTRRSEAVVNVDLDLDAKRWAYRPQKLALYPPGESAAPVKVLLYDPLGETRSALQKLGIQARPADLSADLPANADVLVVGRGGLDETVAASAKNIRQFVTDGGRVVCLAQRARNFIRWLPVTLRRARRFYVGQVVPTSAGATLLDGLGSDDLSFWPNDRRDPDKVVGCVARYPYKKPPAGRVRCLLECGRQFDLAALLECRIGKGVVWLSQLELVPVVGVSPVADLLLRRLICLPPDPVPTRSVWYAGDQTGLKLLRDSLGIDARRLADGAGHGWGPDDLLVWMPGRKAAPPPETSRAVERALGRGACLLACAPEAGALPPLPGRPAYGSAMEYKDRVYVLQVKKPRGYRGPEGRFIKMALLDRHDPLTTGLSNADMFRPSARGGIEKLADYEIENGNGWAPLARPGVIACRRRGQSIQVISTLVRDPQGQLPDSYRRILHGLLVNLGAESVDPRIRLLKEFTGQRAFNCVDLRPYCNMGFADKTEADRQGGFSDQGARSLGNLPTGKQSFLGVPYEIIDPAENDGKSCLELGFSGVLKWLPKRIEGIRIGGRKVRYIHFLHTSSWTPAGDLGHYLVRYERVTEQVRKVPIVGGRNIADWSSLAEELPDAAVAWRGVADSGDTVAVYAYRWKNPIPDVPIDTIDFIGQFRSSLCLIAITIEYDPHDQ